jgi:hypothetical protein
MTDEIRPTILSHLAQTSAKLSQYKRGELH